MAQFAFTVFGLIEDWAPRAPLVFRRLGTISIVNFQDFQH